MVSPYLRAIFVCVRFFGRFFFLIWDHADFYIYLVLINNLMNSFNIFLFKYLFITI